ncbi:MAG: hypothetical protein HOV81_37805 [Kofleriaceae bacterium]|nr:hypothetical protein [Kofleriaceae bacterium]
MTYAVEWRLDRAHPPRYHFQGLDLVQDPPVKGEEGEVVKSIATMSSGDMAADVHGRATAASRAATDTLRDLLGMSIVPFPAAPVGVGARWHVGGRAAPGIQPLDAELDYELVAFDGDTIKIHWSGTVKNASEGVNASIDGTADVQPTDLLPSTADFTERIDLGASFGSAVDAKLADGIAIKLR